MKKNIELIIQKELNKLTSKKFSKNYICNYILPIIDYFNKTNDKKFIISGSQGAGKSTLSQLIKMVIEKTSSKKVMLLSIDDYYYSKIDRYNISKQVHPLLMTRGVPGTHDIKKLKEHLRQFKKKQFPISAPTFNKLKDDISKKTKVFNKADILILEGWCCGSNPIENKFLYKNLNKIERDLDKDFKWRKYFNSKLKNEYQQIFKTFDRIIYLQPPSFQFVQKWRYTQEKNNAKKTKTKNFMDKNTTKNFILYYEKLTKWMIKNMPDKADMLIKIDKEQKIKKIIFMTDNFQ
tara:strand:+ start:1004 stop:1879 length:876 start_codon:yes stop_codon:yes gene_type:complete